MILASIQSQFYQLYRIYTHNTIRGVKVTFHIFLGNPHHTNFAIKTLGRCEKLQRFSLGTSSRPKTGIIVLPTTVHSEGAMEQQ
jgi:hypothetical protein